MLLADAPQLFRRLQLQAELRFHPRHAGDRRRDWSASFQPGTRRTVSQLGPVAEPCRINIVARHLARIEHMQFDDDGTTVLRVQQRSPVRGQFARQHREDGHAGINRSRLRRRVEVYGRPFGDGAVHIGNPHQQAHGAIRKFLDVFHLVQVPRTVVVNGRPEERTQVTRRRPGIFWRWRKIRLESRLQHGLMRAGIKIVNIG